MEEMTWQGKLLKANINITYIDTENQWIYFDFAYRPKSGVQQRWGKTIVGYKTLEDIDQVVAGLKEAALILRKELEG